MEYVSNPVKMGGIVKEVLKDKAKIHLHGRLGVITVDKCLIMSDMPVCIGHETEFFFSYIQVVESAYDYDNTGIISGNEIIPCLLGGKIVKVNETAIEVAIMKDMGTIGVPRRWVFTPIALQEGQDVEFYFSRIKVTGKRDIPMESV